MTMFSHGTRRHRPIPICIMSQWPTSPQQKHITQLVQRNRPEFLRCVPSEDCRREGRTGNEPVILSARRRLSRAEVVPKMHYSIEALSAQLRAYRSIKPPSTNSSAPVV